MTLWTRIREIAGNMNVAKPPRVAHPHVSKPDRQQKPEPLPNGIKAANAAINATAPIPVGPAVTLPPVTHRKVGTDGIALMHSFEGCAKKRPDGRFEAYPDPGSKDGHPWTIGWGSTGPDPFNGGQIRKGTIWTQEQCDMRFAVMLGKYEDGVRQAIGKAATSQLQFDAMVCLCYNIGVGAFQRSTVARKHKAGDFDGAAKAFLMWVKNDGKVMRGLVRRRDAEAALYRKGS